MRKLFGRKKKTQEFNREEKQPVLRASICTGEKVAGFKDKTTNKFEEVMLIRNDGDLKDFMEKYEIRENEIKKEW